MTGDRTLLSSLLRFGLVGGITVGIDAAVYALLAVVGTPLDAAKAISFLIGAIFAYVANWRFTFGERRGRLSEVLFVIVYLFALAINVAVNAGVRALLGNEGLALVISFVVATGISALWNFIGMSLFVFRRPETMPIEHRNDADE